MKNKDGIEGAVELMASSKSRAPEHIKRVLGLIEDAWTRAPDLRLMQLIINLADIKCENSSIYHLEDEVLEKKLLRMSETFEE